jgi:hypothetical protein
MPHLMCNCCSIIHHTSPLQLCHVVGKQMTLIACYSEGCKQWWNVWQTLLSIFSALDHFNTIHVCVLYVVCVCARVCTRVCVCVYECVPAPLVVRDIKASPLKHENHRPLYSFQLYLPRQYTPLSVVSIIQNANSHSLWLYTAHVFRLVRLRPVGSKQRFNFMWPYGQKYILGKQKYFSAGGAGVILEKNEPSNHETKA